MSTLQVAASIDDAYQVSGSFSPNVTSTTIVVGGANDVALRFRSTSIAKKTAIAKAILKFPTVTTATGSGNLGSSMVLRGGADIFGSSSAYNDSGFGFNSGIPTYEGTFATVDGTKIATTTAQFQTTGIDVTEIVQEIVDNLSNPGGSTYNGANDIILMFIGSGTTTNSVTVGTYDGSPGSGATLDITFATESTGTATTASQDAVGDAAWSVATGPLVLTHPGAGTGGWASYTVTAKGFGLSIPTGAYINGIDVKATVSGSTAFLSKVQIVTPASVVGLDHAYQNYTTTLSSSATQYWGGAVDKWGLNLTASDVNDSTFGVQFRIHNTSGGGGSASISNIQIIVHYSNDNLGNYTLPQVYKGVADVVAQGNYMTTGNQGFGENIGVIKITNNQDHTLNLTRIALTLRAVYSVVSSGGGKDGGFDTVYDRSATPATFRVYTGFSGTLPLSGATLVQTWARKLKGPRNAQYNLYLDSPLALSAGSTLTIAVEATGTSGVGEPGFVTYQGADSLHSGSDSSQVDYKLAALAQTGSPGVTYSPGGVAYELFETVPPGGANLSGNSSLVAAGYDVGFGNASFSGNSALTATGHDMTFGGATLSGNSKMYADRIKFVGNSNFTVDGSINPLAITKTYQYKIYDDSGAFLGTWNDVVSEFGYSQEINSAGSAISVTLARNSDTATAAYDVLADDTGASIITDDSNELAAETKTLNAIGPGTTVDLNLNVKIYEFSSDTTAVAGDLVFTGYISMYTSQYGTTENTVVSIFSYGADLDNYLLLEGGVNTRVPFLSLDPSTILTQALTTFNTDGGIITYTQPGSVDLTGTVVTYTFNANTMLEVIKKCLELAPTDWFFYADLASNLLYFKPRPTDPDHYFFLGRHILGLSLEKTMEGITNDVLFTGGKPTNTVVDRFNDVTGTLISAHSAEIGGLWTVNPASAAGSAPVITNANRVRGNVAADKLVFNSQAIPTNDVTVSADITIKSLGDDSSLIARVDPSAATYYAARINYSGYSSSQGIELYRCVAGSFTIMQQLALPAGKTLVVGNTYHLELKIEGAQITVSLDGTSYLDMEDRTIITGQYAGLRFSQLASNTTLSHFDNFTVTPLNDDNVDQIYKRYTDSTSITNYRRGLERVTDNRVTLESSADAIVGSMIDRAKNPRYRSTVQISGSTYDIRTIQLGDLVGFRNFGNFVDGVTMQVVRIDYTPDAVTLQLDTLLPSVPKRLEDIKRNLNQEQVEDNPDAPDT